MASYNCETRIGRLYCLRSVDHGCRQPDQAGLSSRWINVSTLTAAMGAIVAIIGLELAPVAADMAGLTAKTLDPKVVELLHADLRRRSVWLCAVPRLSGRDPNPDCHHRRLCSRTVCLGLVDFTNVAQASVFQMPTFYSPTFELAAIITILPAAFVVIARAYRSLHRDGRSSTAR